MTDFEQAFEELLSANTEACGGVPQQVILGGFSYDSIVGVMTESDKVIAGCVAESQGFKAMVRNSVQVPGRYQPASAIRRQGRVDLKVLGSNQNDGYTEVQIGDPSA